jgi:hypothetical protein
MPIEIKELVIKAVVQDDSLQAVESSSRPLTENQINEIIAECVEQVLTIIKEKQER